MEINNFYQLENLLEFKEGGIIMPKVMIEMEMPKSCGRCPICSTEIAFNYDQTFDIYECPFVGTVDPDKRYKTCPLKEVKE